MTAVEIEKSCANDYLDMCKPRKSLNRKFTTYALKHDAERLWRTRGLSGYVTQLVFEQEARRRGYTVTDDHLTNITPPKFKD